MQLTPAQLNELYKAIHLYIYGFIAENIGGDLLVEEELKLLQESGIDVSKIQGKDIIETAFKFGVISTMLPESTLKKLTFNQLKTVMQSSEFNIPLSKMERYALENVRRQAYSDIKGLGNRIESRLNNMVNTESATKRAAYEKVIRETAEEAVLKRKSIAQLKSDLGHATGDWSRDFERIADFIMHAAYDRGRAEGYKEWYGKDVEVYRSVYKGACKKCIELYLTAGIGSEPIVFKLPELEANGTNIGLKQADWKPVLGSTHPFCRCTTFPKPVGYLWNPADQMYSTVDPNWKPRHKGEIKVSLV